MLVPRCMIPGGRRGQQLETNFKPAGAASQVRCQNAKSRYGAPRLGPPPPQPRPGPHYPRPGAPRRRTRTIRTAASSLITPRGGATPLPRHAQPLLLVLRPNPPPLRRGGGQMTLKPNTQNRAPLMCLSCQPALKVRLAASSKRGGNELAWAVNAAPTAAALWAERTCEVANDAAQNARAVL